MILRVGERFRRSRAGSSRPNRLWTAASLIPPGESLLLEWLCFALDEWNVIPYCAGFYESLFAGAGCN